jgi:hypothetical protein
MNKSWILLIIMGLVFLAAAIGWEAYQNFSGARSNIDISVIEYQRETLLSPRLEKHLTTDPAYINRTDLENSSSDL